MKTTIISTTLLLLSILVGCQEYSVSYLNAKNINYPNNTLTIVQGLTDEDKWEPQTKNPFPVLPSPLAKTEKKPSKYKARIENKAPWLSQPFWGASVEGSRPLTIEIDNVKAKGEKANADLLKKYVTIYGEGVFSVPFDNEIPIGEYLISLRISNISGYQVIDDCFTILVTDVKW